MAIKHPDNGNITKQYTASELFGWEGCQNLDCLPECKPSEPDRHCERLARHLQKIAAVNG